MPDLRPLLIFFVAEDWYFQSHRLPLAKAALADGYRVAVACRVEDHAAALEAAGIRVIPLRHFARRGGGITGNLRALAEIIALYRRERPALVHHVALKPVMMGGVAAMLARVPRAVAAIAGLGYVFSSNDWRARALRPVFRMGFRLLLNQNRSRVIVQNEDDHKALVDHCGVAESRVALIRGAGVDLDDFRPSPEPPAPPVAALVGRLLWDKGVGTMVEAARLLRQRGAAVRMVLVGRPDPGNPKSVDQATLDGWVAEGLVEWWGYQADVAAVWRQAHIALFPTFYGEGLPKSLLEAAASARAIVSTNAPGCREFVRDGVNGLLVAQRDAAALADAVGRLADDAALRARLAAAARATVENGYSTDQVNRQVLQVYRGEEPEMRRAS